jgi:type II secretory pathway pseudopilin PulG
MKMESRGFVLIELAVVFGMIAVLVGLTTVNIFGARRKASLTATIDTLVSDITSQQTKAMSSVVSSGVVPFAYGVRFDANQYTLFQGLAYNPSDTANAVIALDPRVTFSAISLPDSSVVFASQSGEIIGFVPASNSITVNQIDSGEIKTIQLNRYGVITSIN